MNDLDLMERFRADLPPADPAALARARARMFATPATRPARARWVWRLAPAGALAVAAAVAVATVHAAPSPQAGPTTTTTTAQAAPDAPHVLLLAAAEARREPALKARPDQFVYIESRVVAGGAKWGTTGATYVPPVEKDRRIWLSVDGSRPGTLEERPAAGGSVETNPKNEDGGLYGDGGPGTPAYRDDLPTGAKAMRAYLYRVAKNKNPSDARAFTRVGDTLREEYVPPASVAALFEAASTIPGTKVVREADLAGRKGVAVSLTAEGIRHDLIFDSATYHFLGERSVVVVDNIPPFPKGAVIDWTAQIRVAIVDRPGQLP
jgi:hypothetical protein